MAKTTIPGSITGDMRDALRSMGIDPNTTRRVVLVLDATEIPIVYVEHYADMSTVDVMRVLARDPNVRIDRGQTTND